MDTTTLNNILLFTISLFSAGLTAIWLGLTLWTWSDMRARSRDPLAQIAATATVFLLPGFGIIVYLMLRPHETLADAYERSLEEEALLQEIEAKPHCPGCGRQVKHHWQVCPYCHTRLKKACVNCAAILDLTWNICPECTTPQVSIQEPDDMGTFAQAPTGNRPRGISQTASGERSPYEFDDGEQLRYVDE